MPNRPTSQEQSATVPGFQQPKGYAQQTVTVAAALTVPAGATYADITVSGAGIRFRDDGTNPTATVGMPVAAGSVLNYTGDLAALRVVSQGGTATLDISYYS